MESITKNRSHPVYQKVRVDGPGSIRLIHLLPGAPTDELRCTLVSADLSASPSYEALSYVWGEPVFDATIVCNEDVPFKITSSLYCALVRLRAVDKPRVLWVDQICINQNDNPGEATQVKHMTRIYSQCQNAIVWLGDVPPELQTTLVKFIQTLSSAQKQQHRDGMIRGDNDVSALQLSEMGTAQRKRYGLPDWPDTRWKLLLYIYASLWMRRTWIVQEVALPRKVDVQIGFVIIDWRSLSSILFYVESLKVFGLSFGSLGSWKAFLALWVRRARTQEGEFSPLSELLFEHRRVKATDARDRIFGLMVLSAEREEMHADYEATIARVFTDATIDIFRRSGNLDILGLVGSVRLDRPDDLPSWVPDYGSPQGPHPITKRGGHGQLSFIIDGRTLVIPALIIGEIHELAGCCGGQRDDDVDLQNGLGQDSVVYALQELQDYVEVINTSLSWEKFARRSIGTSLVYKPTGESMQDTFVMTYYEGQVEKITDEIRAVHALEIFATTVWGILTLGFGCTWLPLAMPLVTISGFVVWISRPVWSFLGYPSVSTIERYADMSKDVIERRLCTTKNGLVGLAPPDSVPGDRLALLQAGRVPVVLRQDVDGYRLIGEAYVHGAMYGEMFDDQKVAKIKIK